MNFDTSLMSSFLIPLSLIAAVTAPIAAPPTTAPRPIGPASVARTIPAAPPNDRAAGRARDRSDLSLVTVSLPPGAL